MMLYLKIIGDRLPLTYIDACIQGFGADNIQQTAMRGERALSTPKIYSCASVNVAFTPQKMTWMLAREVANALETIIANENWTWASDVAVADANEGVVGYLSITRRMQDMAASSLASDHSQPTQPASSTRNLTASRVLTPRPVSPYPYVIPGSHISIICAAFGRTLPSQIVHAILLEAELFVSHNIMLEGPLAPVNNLARWSFGNVVIEVDPSEKLRWSDLATALEGVLDFVRTFDTFAFTFEIRYQGFRSLGFGRLGLKS